MAHSWEDKAAGRACPFDYPRSVDHEFVFVRKLSVSSLYLERNQTYRGHSVLIYDTAHMLRIDQLSADEWAEFARDTRTAEAAVFSVVRSDHMNVASLGNVLPHLHWHIVPRYRSDPHWGGPIWTTDMPVTQLAEHEYRELALGINEAIDRDREANTVKENN